MRRAERLEPLDPSEKLRLNLPKATHPKKICDPRSRAFLCRSPHREREL